MSSWIVRLGMPSDGERLVPVLRSAYPVLPASCEDAAPAADVLAAMTAPPMHLLGSGRYFVAEAEHRLIGCGGWSFRPPRGVAGRDGVAHLRHFATHASHARQGVGRSLFDASLRQIRSERAKRIDVVSTPAAESFYRSLGFEPLGPFTATIGGIAFPSVYLTMRLAG